MNYQRYLRGKTCSKTDELVSTRIFRTHARLKKIRLKTAKGHPCIKRLFILYFAYCMSLANRDTQLSENHASFLIVLYEKPFRVHMGNESVRDQVG